MNRIYIITYDIFSSQNGAFKYARNPEKEERVNYYGKEERGAFIKEYKRLTDPDKSHYIDNVQCFYAVPTKIEDMEVVINAL